MSDSYTGPANENHPLGGIHAVMDTSGMLPQDSFFCLGCGKTLNADGGHPAELYAGTWNGLCYGCTGRGAFVVKVSVLDGAREVSWPPSCPSYRRDREKYTAYGDCEACKGLGVGSTGSSMGGGTYRRQCEPCLTRYCAHPLRIWDGQRRELLMRRAQAAFERGWDAAAGVPRKCSNKRRLELREAIRTAMDEDSWKAFKEPYLSRYKRLAVRHKAKADRRGLNAWTEPAAETARWEAAVQRRAADLGITA